MTLAYITHPDCQLHDMGRHPECPERIAVINAAIKAAQLDQYIGYYEATPATKAMLLRAHHQEYIDKIYQASPQTDHVWLDPDTGMNPHTLRAALLAAGAGIQAVDMVLTGAAQQAFCNVRPPGHHAEHNKAMGFCFFNNIAVATAHALEQYQLQRIAIVDFDVHHGNGTEDIFKHDSRVLLCSSFQHPFYPGVRALNPSNHIIHIPLYENTESEDFRAAIEQQCLPKLNAFAPELIFISAGFDAHFQDNLAGLQLVTEDYAWITQHIKNIADQHCAGRMISMLEGGYALSVLGDCAVAHVKALLGLSPLM